MQKKNTKFFFSFLYVCSNYLGHMVKGLNFVTNHSPFFSFSIAHIQTTKSQERRNITAIYMMASSLLSKLLHWARCQIFHLLHTTHRTMTTTTYILYVRCTRYVPCLALHYGSGPSSQLIQRFHHKVKINIFKNCLKQIGHEALTRNKNY